METDMELKNDCKIAELMEKASEIERKLAAFNGEIELLPVHAPLRVIKTARYIELSKEFRLVMNDLMEATGQIPFFPEVTD